jgi:hypothetical protein
VPIWVWLIVIGGFAYGLVEVGLSDRRARRSRVRRMRARSERIGFTYRADDGAHELSALLVLFSTLERPSDVAHVHQGTLASGVAVTVFDFDEDDGTARPQGRVAFALQYPTDWPTYELSLTASSRLQPKRRVTSDADGLRVLDPRPSEHEFSRVLLASPLCEFLASQRSWTFGFSGPYAFGATDRVDEGDLRYVLQVAQGVVDRLPGELVESWAVDPTIMRRPRRRAS